MSRRCELCGKGPQFGHNVSHSKVRTPKKSLPNLHRVRIMLDGKRQKLNICTSCLKKVSLT